MKTLVTFADGAYGDLLKHLLPPRNRLEQAAFLYARARPEGAEIRFEVVEIDKLRPIDFELQLEFHLELRDSARARVIKRAHDLGASLIEIHSHTGGLPAAFSASDFAGLRDTVPNILWRLKGRPYIAMVAAQSGFDALVWLRTADEAEPLSGVVSEGRMLKPTNISIGDW